MEGMANIQKLARQALKTFKTASGLPLKENLDLLMSMMGAITAEDVNLTPPTRERRLSYPGEAPVSHVDILECPYFSMAVFIVSKGRKLPLHDHPGMYGFCKVLYGSIQVNMYGTIDSEHENTNGAVANHNEMEPRKFLYQGKHIFDSDNGVCVVSPSHGNLHSIHAINGPAAFLDILGPPYSTEKGRDCLYYKECHREDIVDKQSNVIYLKEIPCPQEFFCNSQAYRGPVVKYEDIMQPEEEE
ncbi:2-aminoethanethiol dioxygenase-like [Dendronephthya gigantea]|uniref:2-aminoethanethiol dioxygenase-like n=1 Tax=Dendronephthya gigantea TaxID=151771 RepID=UPI00106C9053|nr:2-aminoethanethiol dioxygenase-like [Dendronephthya gigantea]